MLLTIRDVDDDLVQQVKDATWNRTGSQAFIAAARMFLEQRKMLAKQEQQIEQLREQVATYQQVLAKARDSAIQLAEIASQGDMFQPKDSAPSRLRHHLG